MDDKKRKPKFTKREDKICSLLGWLVCHADEDTPSHSRSEDFTNSLNNAVEFLENPGWYYYNSNKNIKVIDE
jgi:hypothetical protein